MRNIPLAAMVGLMFTGLYFAMAILAPWIAPYGMAEIVGDVWEPSSPEHLL
ncbi:MAG: ABC transporter permease, partial [Lutimaribacter sp.]